MIKAYTNRLSLCALIITMVVAAPAQARIIHPKPNRKIETIALNLAKVSAGGATVLCTIKPRIRQLLINMLPEEKPGTPTPGGFHIGTLGIKPVKFEKSQIAFLTSGMVCLIDGLRGLYRDIMDTQQNNNQ